MLIKHFSSLCNALVSHMCLIHQRGKAIKFPTETSPPRTQLLTGLVGSYHLPCTVSGKRRTFAAWCQSVRTGNAEFSFRSKVQVSKWIVLYWKIVLPCAATDLPSFPSLLSVSLLLSNTSCSTEAFLLEPACWLKDRRGALSLHLLTASFFTPFFRHCQATINLFFLNVVFSSWAIQNLRNGNRVLDNFVASV